MSLIGYNDQHFKNMSSSPSFNTDTHWSILKQASISGCLIYPLIDACFQTQEGWVLGNSQSLSCDDVTHWHMCSEAQLKHSMYFRMLKWF